jgi:hypothetical protein
MAVNRGVGSSAASVRRHVREQGHARDELERVDDRAHQGDDADPGGAGQMSPGRDGRRDQPLAEHRIA